MIKSSRCNEIKETINCYNRVFCLVMVQVSVESVMAIFKSNVANVKTLLLAAIPRIASKEWTDITKERQVC